MKTIFLSDIQVANTKKINILSFSVSTTWRILRIFFIKTYLNRFTYLCFIFKSNLSMTPKVHQCINIKKCWLRCPRSSEEFGRWNFFCQLICMNGLNFIQLTKLEILILEQTSGADRTRPWGNFLRGRGQGRGRKFYNAMAGAGVNVIQNTGDLSWGRGSKFLFFKLKKCP